MSKLDRLALILLAAIWGSSYLFIRVAVDAFDPLIVALLRVLIGGSGLLLFAAARGRRVSIRRHWQPFLVLGVFNAAVPYWLIAFSEQHINASLAGILNATTPLFVAGIVAGINREHVPPRTVMGLGLGMLGVAVLVGWNGEPLTRMVVFAVIAMLAASLSYGAASVFAKKSLRAVSTLDAAIGQQVGGAVWLAPAVGLASAGGGASAHPTAKAVMAMLALGLVCTSAAYLLYFHLLASAGPVRTSSVTFLIPVFGIAWAALFLDEPVRASMLLGGVLILASSALVTGTRLPLPWSRAASPVTSRAD